MGTDVLGKALLSGMADVQTAKIDSYCQRNALFQTACNGLHGDTPRLNANRLVGVEGGNDRKIIRLLGSNQAGIQDGPTDREADAG